MGVRVIQCGDEKPRPFSIINESLYLGLPFTVFLEGVLELVAVTWGDVETHNIEDIAIHQIGGVAGIRIRMFWRGKFHFSAEMSYNQLSLTLCQWLLLLSYLFRSFGYCLSLKI